MNEEHKIIFRKIIYAVETGSQLYGKAVYDAFVEAFTNSEKEYAITIGAGQWYGIEAKELLRLIQFTNPQLFAELDTENIESDLNNCDWNTYQLECDSKKADCIRKIIGSSTGIKCQDAMMDEQCEAYIREAIGHGVDNIQAQMMYGNITHLGGTNAAERILAKMKKPYTLDGFYIALTTDQNDLSSENQVGDKRYWSRHVQVYTWIKDYVTDNEEPKGEETTMAITEKKITLCGHGSGTPSIKNMHTYLSSRYNSVASNGVRKGVVCVLRLKTLTDSGREKFVSNYASILGRNKYNQALRTYVYRKYKDGKYYSDCSSSICATFSKIGYKVAMLNTAGMYYSSLFEKVPVKISNGHITNPEVLKVGDCIMFAGNDPSRPKQIGHVEAVYKIDGKASSSTSSSGAVAAKQNESNVTKGQKWLNSNYGELIKKHLGALLVADGDYGKKSRAAAVCVWKNLMNRKFGFKLDPGNENFLDTSRGVAEMALIRKRDDGTLVYLAEFILSAKGFYTGKMDADFGSGLKSAVEAFQRSRGLEADGVVGKDTWYALFN